MEVITGSEGMVLDENCPESGFTGLLLFTRHREKCKQ